MTGKTLAAVTFFTVVSAIPAASQTLTVSVTGSGNLSGTGINCGSDCSETIPMITSTRGARPGRVTLTASGLPTSGPTWGGACQGIVGTTCTVTVPPGGAMVSAGFAIAMPDMGGLGGMLGNLGVLVSTVGPGKVVESTSGTVRTFTAEPTAGATFASWSGPCTGGNPVCTVTTTATSSLVASFGWPVTVAIEGPPGGSVTGKGVDCRTVCTGVAVPPTLSLQATPAAGYEFQQWGGDCTTAGSTTSGAVCSLSATGPKSVTARFRVVLIIPPPPL